MTALQAYLQNSKTRKVLSKKPGEAGFSLIELVVVVAVLAVLAAIAIPAYTNITEKGRTSAAKTALANAAKECAVSTADEGAANAKHTVLADGSGLFFSTGLKAGTCAGFVNEGVCVDNAVKTLYTANLVAGTKTSGAVITAPSTLTANGLVACPVTTLGTAW